MALTPEIIQSKLFHFRTQAHKFHLDTRSYAEHKTLGKLYESLSGFTDEISEKLMGYQKGKRIGVGESHKLEAYSTDAVSNMVKEGEKFAYELYEWAGEKKYCDLENIAQSLSGLFAQTAYLLTLS